MTESTSPTPFSTKAEILSDLWMTYRTDEEFKDFVEYNDLGLPLAYAVANQIVEVTETSTRFIEETFDLLLAGLDTQDEGYENLEDLLSQTGQME